MTCSKCEGDFDESGLLRCPICHKMVCERCRTNRGGKYFCSQYCAEYFFYYEEDED